MIDVSEVRTDSTDEAVAAAIEVAADFGCYLVTTLPAQARRAHALLAENPDLKLGGNVGFPSGGQTTRIKVLETRELIECGVDEVDMVIDVAAHLSGNQAYVEADIAAVVAAAEGLPVKVILECHYLTDDQIRAGCDAAMVAGAAYVKTGTGWAPTGATLHNITVIQKHVGNRIALKASGGIRDRETVAAMYSLGVRRFGVAARHVPALVGPATSGDDG